MLEQPDLAEEAKVLATPTLDQAASAAASPRHRRSVGQGKAARRPRDRPRALRPTRQPNATRHDRATTDVRMVKLPTGIESFDIIAKGGLPKGRTTLISGTAGSGKTAFAVQFLAAGIRSGTARRVRDVRGVGRRHPRRTCAASAGISAQWEREGKLAVVDASPDPNIETVESGSVRSRRRCSRASKRAVERVNAERVSVDSLGAMFSQFSDQSIVRRELFRIAWALKRMGVTALLTAERTQDYGPVARFGVEEFIADNVMILRNVLDGREPPSNDRDPEVPRHRSSEGRVSRSRSSPAAGVVVMPLSAMQLRAEVVGRAHLVGQRRARPDVRRRILPRFGDPRLRRDRHRQDAHGHAVPARRRSRRRALPAARLRGEPRAAVPQRERVGHRLRGDGARRTASRRLRISGDGRARGSAALDAGDDRGVQAAARGAGQPVGARARRDDQGVSRVRHRPHVVHQASGDHRASSRRRPRR